MDPVSAIGVAAAAIDFLNLALQALSLCRQIRDNYQGATDACKELETYLKSLKKLSTGLAIKTQSGNPAGGQVSLHAEQCVAAADKLQALLLVIYKEGSSKKTTAVKITFRKMKENRNIEKLLKDLENRRRELELAIKNEIHENVDLIANQQSKEFPALNSALQELNTKLGIQQATIEKHRNQTDKDLSTIKTQTEELTRASLALQSSVNSQTSAMMADSERYFGVSSASHSKTHEAISSVRNSIDIQFSRLLVKDVREDFLRSLFYAEYNARREDVEAPFERTFQWVFDRDAPPDTKRSKLSWSNFTHWLEYSDSLYWVTGKPGSGKSTLMAHIINSERTKDSLQKWAADKPLHMLSFFFWRPGSEHQRSIQGLIRSLLYQLFQEIPDLADAVIRRDSLHAGRIPVWTAPELRKLLRLALEISQDRRFCFFIDGLDESHDDLNTLIDIVLSMQDFPHVKLCVSSRPELKIKPRLTTFSQLKMERLNWKDIATFVHSKLNSTDTFPLTSYEIANRANGVFLWAALVVKDVVDGIESGDDDDILLRRLARLPPDLNDMFKHMLSKVDPIHQQTLGHIFRIVAMTENTNVPLIATYFNKGKLITYEKLWERCAKVERQILAQSKGLLEVLKPDSVQPCCPENDALGQCATWAIPNATLSSHAGQDPQSINFARTYRKHGDVYEKSTFWESARVRWVHRSAFDFIFVSERALAESCVTLPLEHDVMVDLIAAKQTALIMGPSHDLESHRGTVGRLRDLIFFISSHVYITPAAQHEFLDATKSLISCFNSEEMMYFDLQSDLWQYTDEVEERYDRLFIPMQTFWGLCVDSGIYEYVEARLCDIAANDHDCRVLIPIIHLALSELPDSEDLPNFRPLTNVIASALSLTLQNFQSRFSGCSKQSATPVTTEVRHDHGLHSISWTCSAHMRMSDTLQEDTLITLDRAFMLFMALHIVVLDEATPRVRSELDNILNGFLQILELWEAKIQHIQTLEARTPTGIVAAQIIIRYFSLTEWSAMTAVARQSEAHPIPAETCLEIQDERREQPAAQRSSKQAPKGREVLSGEDRPNIQVKLSKFWTMWILDEPLHHDTIRWQTSTCNELLREISENAEGNLDSWQQRRATKCLKIIKRMTARSN